MSVLANRQRLGWGSWGDILDGIPKKSSLLEQPSGYPTAWEPNFTRILAEVGSIYDGSKDYSSGGLYWCELNKIENPWFKENILGQDTGHTIVSNMNSLTIFR